MPERIYTVSGQQQVRGYDEGRNLVDMYEVFYAGPNGISGSVRVPVRDATPELVDALILARLSMQQQIGQLGTPS